MDFLLFRTVPSGCFRCSWFGGLEAWDSRPLLELCDTRTAVWVSTAEKIVLREARKMSQELEVVSAAALYNNPAIALQPFPLPNEHHPAPETLKQTNMSIDATKGTPHTEGSSVETAAPVDPHHQMYFFSAGLRQLLPLKYRSC